MHVGEQRHHVGSRRRQLGNGEHGAHGGAEALMRALRRRARRGARARAGVPEAFRLRVVDANAARRRRAATAVKTAAAGVESAVRAVGDARCAGERFAAGDAGRGVRRRSVEPLAVRIRIARLGVDVLRNALPAASDKPLLRGHEGFGRTRSTVRKLRRHVNRARTMFRLERQNTGDETGAARESQNGSHGRGQLEWKKRCFTFH
mmetsp:Transcript_228/g.894  ORF Transcript_228/g.894 Transcript_228/m.894 type:complete len:205 (-) Transcript_228:125-739(-)